MALSIYSRTLQKAAELLGGRARLCRHLQVPSSDLQSWIDDKTVPPTSIFLRVVDVILEETPPPPASGSEPPDPPAPRDAASGSSAGTWY